MSFQWASLQWTATLSAIARFVRSAGHSMESKILIHYESLAILEFPSNDCRERYDRYKQRKTKGKVEEDLAVNLNVVHGLKNDLNKKCKLLILNGIDWKIIRKKTFELLEHICLRFLLHFQNIYAFIVALIIFFRFRVFGKTIILQIIRIDFLGLMLEGSFLPFRQLLY